MPLVCKLLRAGAVSPQLEPLAAETMADAEQEVQALLAFYEDARHADIYSGEQWLACVDPSIAPWPPAPTPKL